MADIVIGFARLEAEAGGELVFGEAAECPERHHRDLLLDRVFLGAGDGLPSMVREHERAVFGRNIEVESDMHGRPFPRRGSDDSREHQICIRNLCQGQETSTVENGQISSVGLMAIYVEIVDRCGRWKGTGQFWQ